MLGKCFLPWTVTRSAWVSAVGPRVSGIATDVMLFSQHGARLVHRYHVFADNRSLRGSFMAKISGFTRQASAEAQSADKHGRDFSTESTSSPLLSLPTPPSPLGPAHRMPDITPPAWKAARPMATVTLAPKPRPILPLLCTVARWRLLFTCHLWASRGQPQGCLCLRLLFRPLVRHRFLSSRRLMSSLLRIVRLHRDLTRRPLPTSCSRLTLMMQRWSMPLGPDSRVCVGHSQVDLWYIDCCSSYSDSGLSCIDIACGWPSVFGPAHVGSPIMARVARVVTVVGPVLAESCPVRFRRRH